MQKFWKEIVKPKGSCDNKCVCEGDYLLKGEGEFTLQQVILTDRSARFRTDAANKSGVLGDLQADDKQQLEA